MNKMNSLITILVIILVLGILYLTLTERINSKPIIQEDKLTNPQENPSASQTNLTNSTAPQELNNDQPKLQRKTYTSAPEMQIDQTKKYFATIKTSEGDIKLELNADDSPITVNNFVFLASDNFYDNTVFHRVVKGFMIQGGDPMGTGAGGPGYSFDDENFVGEYTKGTIAMANAGPNTNGSQFFIMHNDYPLSKDYVIFGKVISGIEVVDKIAEAQVTRSQSGELSKPINPVVISTIEITNN